MSRDRRRRRRQADPEDDTPKRHDAPSDNATQDELDDLYESDLERAWDQAPSVQGIDPSLMGARRGDLAPSQPELPAAALHPGLILFGALMGGPVVAGVLAVFSDGRAPKARELIAILGLTTAGWFGMQGLMSFGPERFGPRAVVLASQGLLLTIGLILLALYLGPMQGRRASDERTRRQSLIVVIGLTALYWLGRDAAWLGWLGR